MVPVLTATPVPPRVRNHLFPILGLMTMSALGGSLMGTALKIYLSDYASAVDILCSIIGGGFVGILGMAAAIQSNHQQERNFFNFLKYFFSSAIILLVSSLIASAYPASLLLLPSHQITALAFVVALVPFSFLGRVINETECCARLCVRLFGNSHPQEANPAQAGVVLQGVYVGNEAR